MLAAPPNKNKQLFTEVCEMIHTGGSGHGKHSPTPESILNRLFRKHLDARPEKYGQDLIKSAPELSAFNVEVTVECKSTEELTALVELEGRRRNPKRELFPVVIVRYCGWDCLIDGGSRIRKWYDEGN